MTLETFEVIPADLPLVTLDIPIIEKLDKGFNDRIYKFLKLFNIDYNQKDVIKTAISLNKKLILSGKIKQEKQLKKSVTTSNELAPKTFIGEHMDDEDYKEKFKKYAESLGEDIPKEALFQNNRVEFLNEIMRKMLSLEFEKDESSCERTSEKDFKPLVHQLIVTRYLNSFTPYRGLLLYHGLGSGKTCSSISIMEGMKNTHKVYIMTPASLQANYRTQMKFCGDQIFKINNHWVFKELKSESNYDDIYSSLGIDKNFVTSKLNKIIKENDGIWIIEESKEPNYKNLDENEQLQIDKQIEVLIKEKYNYINYNGITKGKWAQMSQDSKNNTINPFDNSVIVIDEVHNFVSRIINKIRIKKKSVSTDIYEAILDAENCKIVPLSGTPYINYPSELGVLFNLIGGYTYSLEVTVELIKSSIEEKVFKQILNVPFIDSFDYDQSSHKLKILQNPYGFSKTETGKVIFDESLFITRYEFVEKIKEMLNNNPLFKIKKVEYVKYKKFPDQEKEFNEYFVTSDLKINNKEWFQSKIVGMVSYLGDKSDLMPEIVKTDDNEDIHIEYSDMSLHQIKQYSIIRNDERKLERRKTKKEDENKMNSTYRVFSRACCNFAFPQSLPRPMPKGNGQIAITEDDLDVVDNISLLSDVDGKYDESDVLDRHIDMSYKRRIDEVLQELSIHSEKYFNSDLAKLVKSSKNNMEQKTYPLNENSPKFYKIVSNLLNEDNVGCHLLYTNFRQLEGIGILSLILKYYGFIELRVVKSGTEGYTIELDKYYEDEEYVGDKKYFSLYTGTETPEAKEIIRNIYNSNFSALPLNIVNQINELVPNNEYKNLYGSIIKLLMITASGAEGIDLKNTRFVHITEPYWHHVRINQVIGRARRICSHAQLPPQYRNVEVFMYISKFSKDMNLEEFNALVTQDMSLSTDQSLYNIMERKRGLSVMFLDTLKEASIDCVVNYKDKCVSKPFSKLKNNKLYGIDYKMDPIKKFHVETTKSEIHLKTLDTDGKKVKYAVDVTKSPPILYNFELYYKSLKSGKEPILVKLGRMEEEGVASLDS